MRPAQQIDPPASLKALQTLNLYRCLGIPLVCTARTLFADIERTLPADCKLEYLARALGGRLLGLPIKKFTTEEMTRLEVFLRSRAKIPSFPIL
jgi:hypothetical protein